MPYEIRDPIHGSLTIDEAERRVLDHPWIQRLRSIRQLGFVPVVYPGAVHDRFQHSLGVMHLAGNLLERLFERHPEHRHALGESDRAYARRIVRLAGLLHDVGHAPFSHTSEALLPPVESLELPSDWYRELPRDRQAHHEDVSIAAIHALARDRALPMDVARDAASLLDERIEPGPDLQALGWWRRVLKDLISGEIDADRSDYLLRDSHFTGVRYGVYDLDRLRQCLMIVEGTDGFELGLDIHGIHPLEDLLMARYHMFLQVYFHKTPPAFDYYLAQAVEAEEVSFDLSSLHKIMSLTDDDVRSRLQQAANDDQPWSRRLVRREPAKLVLRERIGADQPENFLYAHLIDRLREAGCHVFSCHRRQKFTNIAGAGSEDGGRVMHCERRILGSPVVESVTAHSDLLNSFNRPIDLRHTYILREDADVASSVLKELRPF